MCYLDTPRLHFTGTFTANPSTINNDPKNYYDPANPDSTPPSAVSFAWNPYGSHVFTISATVTSFVDNNGMLHTTGDPLIGATFESYIPPNGSPAKIVDLDTEQQNVTRLFGLFLQLVLSGTQAPSLQGEWENGGTLVNLWGRVPSLIGPTGGPDSAYGGAFQSVLQNLVWQDGGGSAFLQQLQQAGAAGLSVRLNTYGYQDQAASPGFRIGKISGTIGPAYAGEPLHLPPRLLLSAQPQTLGWAPAKVSGNTVTIDLGNSIPDQSPGGPPASIGTLEAAVLSGSAPTLLGAIDYQAPAFQQTAGVVQFPITSEQTGQPLAILVNGVPQLAENQNGSYVDVDGSSVYMNPGVPASVNLWATSFGLPAEGVPLQLELVPNSPPSGFDNNTPADALSFPTSVTTGANGSAPITIQATHPFPASEMPPSRQSIGGQVYYIGGPWTAGNVASAPLSVKLFNSLQESATWENVQPILYRFYYMYGFMASIVDLSNYDEVVAKAENIKQVLSLEFDDPGYMPVSREMSNDERQLILTWIDNGCPQGTQKIFVSDEAPIASPSDTGSAGDPAGRPWSRD